VQRLNLRITSVSTPDSKPPIHALQSAPADRLAAARSRTPPSFPSNVGPTSIPSTRPQRAPSCPFEQCQKCPRFSGPIKPRPSPNPRPRGREREWGSTRQRQRQPLLVLTPTPTSSTACRFYCCGDGRLQVQEDIRFHYCACAAAEPGSSRGFFDSVFGGRNKFAPWLGGPRPRSSPAASWPGPLPLPARHPLSPLRCAGQVLIAPRFLLGHASLRAGLPLSC
jgi:hypothetical protein